MNRVNVAWWNLQNFFDTTDDPIAHEFDYTAENGWTREKFEQKRRALATVLERTHDGDGPDLLAVCEIEKNALLADLVSEMDGSDLTVVTDQPGSSDLRGIGVAMAYDETALRVLEANTYVVNFRYRTRDIFEVVFELRATGERLVVFASHWPSRSRGRRETEPLRIAVAEHLARLVEDHLKVSPEEYDALRAEGHLAPARDAWETNVLLLGDFNDEPWDTSVLDHLAASRERAFVGGEDNAIEQFRTPYSYRQLTPYLFNPMWQFASTQTRGTYHLEWMRGRRFTNRFHLLDQLVVSRGLLYRDGVYLDADSVDIVRDPSMTDDEGRPRRMNTGTMEGVSDHFPVTATLRW
jgi:endonuclease/exonuclease/phosphatase family metal-dependent hydrolase